MKHKIVFVLLMSFFSCIMYSQNSDPIVNIGDVFTIGEVHNNNYKHINFPRANFIIKKGGIANYNTLKGEKIEICSIKTKRNGSLVATIKLSSNKLFFNSHKYVTVDISEAISNKELLKI